jgi:hypothetical protein
MSENIVYPTFGNPAPRGGTSLGAGLSGSGGGGTLDPMEARVARLEEDMREIKTDLKALRDEMRNGFKDLSASVNKAALDVAEVKGRISQIPTIWPLITLVFGAVGTAVGTAFAIVKHGLH